MQAAGWTFREGFYVVVFRRIPPSLGNLSLFLGPLTDEMRPTHIIESYLLYSELQMLVTF